MNPARKEPDKGTYSGRFAARLKQLREKAKLSVTEVAEKIGVKAITIYGWEQGTRSPHISDLPKIAEVFGFNRIRDVLPEK